jgi:MFS family permease
LRTDITAAETSVERFWRELREGIQFLHGKPAVVLLGITWALFLGAMMTGVVVIAPLSDQILHAGAKGYGWLNAGWGFGALLSALYAPIAIAGWGARRSVAISMGVLTICMMLSPLTPVLALAVTTFGIMGSARGLSSVAINTSIMEQVPQHFMGRVQNTFYFAGTVLQIALAFLVGAVAQYNLVAGFSVIGLVYAVAFVTAIWPAKSAVTLQEAEPAE